MSITQYNTIRHCIKQNPSVSFKGRFIDIPKMPCALCGERMFSAKARTNFCTKFAVATQKGMTSKDAILFFKKLIPFLPPTEIKVISLFDNFAQLHPNKKFSEILKLPEIIEPHVTISNAKKLEFSKKIAPILEEEFSLLSGFSKAKFDEINIEIKHTALNGKSPIIKRYEIEKAYEPCIKSIADPQKADKFILLTKQIPLVERNENDLIAYYAGKDENSILKSLTRNRATSINHFNDPKKLAPHIGVCERCNTESTKIPLQDLFKIFPDLVKNTKKQIQFLLNVKDKKEYSLSDDYFIKLNTFINKHSQTEKIKLPQLINESKLYTKQRISNEKSSFLEKEPKIAHLLSLDAHKTFFFKKMNEYSEKAIQYPISSAERKRLEYISDLFKETWLNK